MDTCFNVTYFVTSWASMNGNCLTDNLYVKMYASL